MPPFEFTNWNSIAEIRNLMLWIQGERQTPDWVFG